VHEKREDSMRWFRKFWVVLIFVLAVLLRQSWSKDNRRDYAVQTDFSCGGVDVKVITHCIYREDLPPFCMADNQYIIIGGKKINSISPKIKSERFPLLNIDPKTRKLIKGKRILPYVIAEITCYKSSTGKLFVELYYYCGGNYPEYEYFEVYDMKRKKVSGMKNLIEINKKSIDY
jgi:hypothetical protein